MGDKFRRDIQDIMDRFSEEQDARFAKQDAKFAKQDARFDQQDARLDQKFANQTAEIKQLLEDYKNQQKNQ